MTLGENTSEAAFLHPVDVDLDATLPAIFRTIVDALSRRGRKWNQLSASNSFTGSKLVPTVGLM